VPKETPPPRVSLVPAGHVALASPVGPSPRMKPVFPPTRASCDESTPSIRSAFKFGDFTFELVAIGGYPALGRSVNAGDAPVFVKIVGNDAALLGPGGTIGRSRRTRYLPAQ
jgi:hypothetical protein